MSKLSITGKAAFDKHFYLFGLASMARYKAQLLLSKSGKSKLSAEKKEEIERENFFAGLNQINHFDEMEKLGIPSYLLPISLNGKKNKQGNTDLSAEGS